MDVAIAVLSYDTIVGVGDVQGRILVLAHSSREISHAWERPWTAYTTHATSVDG